MGKSLTKCATEHFSASKYQQRRRYCSQHSIYSFPIVLLASIWFLASLLFLNSTDFLSKLQPKVALNQMKWLTCIDTLLTIAKVYRQMVWWQSDDSDTITVLARTLIFYAYWIATRMYAMHSSYHRKICKFPWECQMTLNKR